MNRKRTTPLREDTVEPAHCSTALRHEIVGRARYFKRLSPEALEAVNERFREQHYPAEAVIYWEADSAERLFLVAHGKVKLLRHGAEGIDVLLDLLPQGSLFGGVAPVGYRRYSETAVAQTECCVLAITAGDFEELLARHPEIVREVLNSVARSLDDARETIRQLTTSPVAARIATVLIKLAERLGEPDKDGTLIQAPLPQQDIASMVGATPETVSRVMARFKREELVDSGRQWVRILDDDGLRKVAGT